MPYDPDVAASLGIEPQGDPLGRAGYQLANAPSEMFNSFTRMWYNLGFHDEDQTQPVELPTVPLEAPRGIGEKLVDVGSNIVNTVPLIMAGEGAVGAFSKAAELPAMFARIAKPAAGFGALGAAESPEEGALQGALGAGFGAAEAAPLPLKIALAGGIGAVSAWDAYKKSKDTTQAAAIGGAMALMPFFFRGARKAAATGVTTPEELQRLLGGGETPQLTYTQPPLPGFGGLLAESTTRARPIYGTETVQPRAERMFHMRDTLALPEPPYVQQEFPMAIGRTPPEGSIVATGATRTPPPTGALTAEAAMTPAELRRGRGVQPPPGSLIREPTYSPGELETIMKGGTGPNPLDELPVLPAGPASKTTAIATGQDAAMPITVAGKSYGSQEEALSAVSNLLRPKVELEPPRVINEQPLPTTTAPTKRVTLKTVMHPDNKEMLERAAAKLGVEYKFHYGDIDRLEFKVPNDAKNAAAGASFDIPVGATYKDLKNALANKLKAFEGTPPVSASLKAEGTGFEYAERPITAEDAKDFYGPSRWTHRVDITDAKGSKVGKINGIVGPDGFQIKGSNLYGDFKGVGNYPKVIRDLAVKYGRVISDVPELREPAAERAWQKLLKTGEAKEQINGTYVLESPQAKETIATLQPEVPPAKPPPVEPPAPSPIEKADSGEALPPAKSAPGELVMVPHPDDNILEAARVVGPSPELADHVRVKLNRDGMELDIRPKDIQDLPTSKSAQVDEQFKQKIAAEQKLTVTYGSAEDIAALQEQNAKKGMKLGTRVGEHGFYDAELGAALGKYLAVPVVATTITMALSDPDTRIRNGILAFALSEAAVFGISKGIMALAEAHPTVVPKVTKTTAAGTTTTTKGFKPSNIAEALKQDFKDAYNAIKADPKLTQQAARRGQALGWEKVARKLEKLFTTYGERSRIIQMGQEKVHIAAEVMQEGIRTLVAAREAIGKNGVAAIDRFWRGDADLAELLRHVPDKNLSNRVQMVGIARTALQNMILEALPQGALRNAVKESIDSYVTQSYRLFHDPKFFPTDAQIKTFAREIYNAYNKSSPGVPLETLERQIKEHLHELKVNKELFSFKGGMGASIGPILGRKGQHSDAFKQMMGIFDDPLEAMAATELKLVGGAMNAQALSMIADGVRSSDGLKFAFRASEWESHMNRLKFAISRETDPAKVATLQTQLNDLSAYVPVADEARFGRLGGMFVDRRMKDALSHWDGVSRWASSPLAKWIGVTNNVVKYGHTVGSPLQVTRNYVSMPLLGIMAKTTPKDWLKAHNTLMEWYKNPYSAEALRLRSLGVITSSDFLAGELKQDLKTMLDTQMQGKYDTNAIVKGLKNFKRRWETFYRHPDLLIRVAAFQREEARQLGMNVDKVTAATKAIDYANRYTVNYGAAPEGIQILRRLPFTNQYLTFAFEVARITKNLGQDAILRRDPAAIGILTTMATVPIIAQKISEAALSPKDREEWERVKNLSPDYNRSNFRVMIQRLPNGNFHYYDITPLVLHDKWMKMVRDIVNGDVKVAMADNPVFGWNNTPLLNVATSQIAGRDLRTHEKLTTIGSRLDSIRRDLAPTLLGTDLDRFQEALTRNAEGGLGIMSPKTGRETSLSSILGSYATSIRGYSVNPNYMVKQAVYEAKDAADSERMLMNRTVQTNASPATVAAATARYQAALRQIQMQLRDRLRISNADLSSSPSF